MKRLVSLALNQPLFMLLLTVLFIGAGVQAFRALPVEAFPDVTNVQAQVITLALGRAAEEVERQVTIPLERGLSGIPLCTDMRSVSVFGLPSASYVALVCGCRLSVPALVVTHCVDCHGPSVQKANLRLDNLQPDLGDERTLATWSTVHDKLVAGEMPPRKRECACPPGIGCCAWKANRSAPGRSKPTPH